MAPGNSLHRIAPLLLGETLEVEDLPFENPPDIGPGQVGIAFGLETRRDMANGILDHVLEGLIGRGAFRLLPDDERDDEKEHPHEEADETKERGTGHRFEGSSCLVLVTGFSERLDG